MKSHEPINVNELIDLVLYGKHFAASQQNVIVT